MTLAQFIQNIPVVHSQYDLSFSKSELNDFNFKNLQLTFRYLLCGPPQSQGEGLFFRIIHSAKGSCIQCIFFYKTQWIPYHPHDYHPFYIYLDEKEYVQFLVIDGGHHFSQLIPIKPKSLPCSLNLTIFLPDHGITDQIDKFSRIFRPKLCPLTANQLKSWWLINNMAQLKLRTKILDPWAPGLIPESSLKRQSLLSRINYLLPFTLYPPPERDLNYSFRDETVCPICYSMATLDFMQLITETAPEQCYLMKKMKCPNQHDYTIRYNFETGVIEYSPFEVF